MKSFSACAALAAAVWSSVTTAQSSSCAAPAPSGSIRPSVASGYRLQVVATGLSRPRGILFDTDGHLLVVQSGAGSISAHSLDDNDGCVTVSDTVNVTMKDLSLNHGIEMSEDGRTLYASSTQNVYQWDYDPSTMEISNQVTLISNMSGTDHTTRTLLLSKSAPGMLIVSRGSTSNIDIESASLDSGHSQVRAFNLTSRGDNVYSYDTDGVRLGWGLRNEVGLAEHPSSGGIWGVENSADEITRMGVDIHQDNPAEELNFFGYLNGKEYAQQGGNFGYPWCFTAWDTSILPENGDLKVGDQFAIDATAASNNMNKTDEYCAQQIAPTLGFQAHMAPLDIKFNDSGRQAWISFHGSWDRNAPVGYKIAVVEFNEDGQPTEPSTSTTAATDIVSNEDNSVCPNDCFRPVGMVFDQQGRIFMSSDASGELYMVVKETDESSSPSPTSTASGGGSSASASGTTSSGGATSSAANAASGSMYDNNVLSKLAASLISALLMLF